MSTYLHGAFDCVIVMLGMHFRVRLHSIVALMSRKPLLETGAIFQVSVSVFRHSDKYIV